MKTLKFAPDLVREILAGKKTSTWRLFDDKDLQEGDVLLFLNKETGEKFGTAIVTSLHKKTLGSLEKTGWIGHETFHSEEEMYHAFRKYYGDRIAPDTEVKILTFSFSE
jgi:hypothetical protein